MGSPEPPPPPRMAFLLFVLLLCLLPSFLLPMRIDPARIAARLRIEQEGTDQSDRDQRGRSRRQLIGGGSPKEETIQVTAPLFSSRLFEFGSKVGDKELSGGLDMAKRLHLGQPVSFFGQSHSTLWVLSNGAVAFDHGAKQFRANVLPSQGPALIAPFWNRNDLRNGGRVFYREINEGRMLERGQSEIRYQYDREVRVLSAVVVTFEKMQPLGTDPLPEDNTNTFQLALFVTNNGTFANFIYSNIGWTQGAEAGFNAGDGSRHFALPTSGTGNIMYLEDYGNTGIPGEWMFELGEERVVRCKTGIKGDTCDEACSTGEWGPDCEKCCHCADGTCNEVSGECKSTSGGCSQCWRGRNCQQRDPKCDGNAGTGAQQCGGNAVEVVETDRCGEPSTKCQCAVGFQGDPHTQCTDIDECARKDTCHEKATCTNTPGRFFCQCREGYSGDGISECVSAFLYPFAHSHRLPSDRNGRIEWQLKHPLRVFGKERDGVVISTNGLILIREAKHTKGTGEGGEQPRLEQMDVQGVAPFFAPIDLTRQGQIFVEETTDPAVLAKASRMINDQMGEGQRNFVGTHALMVTYENVGQQKRETKQGPKLSNTFQTVLIGGRDKQKRENMTFVEFLYRDIAWSEGAEAGIMAPDKSNSILLPGSGTVGIEQLSQLSNVRSQGIWLFRIDPSSLAPCMQPDLQPPYCDARSPTLINRSPPIHPTFPIGTTPTTMPTTSSSTTTTTTTTTTTATTTTKTTTEAIEVAEEKDGQEERQKQEEQSNKVNKNHHYQQKQPTTIGKKVPPELPRVEQSGWQPVEEENDGEEAAGEEVEVAQQTHIRVQAPEQPQKAQKPTEGIQRTTTIGPEDGIFGVIGGRGRGSTSRKPAIVTIQSKEIEEMPPDAFEEGTVVDGDGERTQTKAKMTTTTTRRTTTTTMMMSRNNLNIEEEEEEEVKDEEGEDPLGVPEVIVPELVGGQRHGGHAGGSNPSSFVQDKEPELRVGSVVAVASTESTRKLPKFETTETTTSATPPKQRPPIPEEREMTTEGSTTTTMKTTTTMAEVFTKSPKPTSTKRAKITTEVPKVKAESPDGAEEPVLMDFDSNNQLLDSAGMPANKLSVVVPVAIVLIWLLVLVIVAVFLCCRRRQTQERLRALYGPAYQIRPVYTMRVNKLGSAYGDGPYEEHLEKAAQRLSADMSYQSNPFAPGRYSLYGSYWNISPEGSAAGRANANKLNGNGKAQQSPPMEISSPRSSNDSGAGSGGSGFGTYIGQCMAKNNGSSPDRGEQAEYLANSQRSTARFSSSNGGGGGGRH